MDKGFGALTESSQSQKKYMRNETEMQKAKTMKMEKPSSTPFSLSDFYLAAYLLCKGLKLLGTDPNGKNRIHFLLDDSPDRPQLIEDYYAHRAVVDPLSFKDAVVNLKSFLHGLKQVS